MSTSLTPYRQSALIEVEEKILPKKLGLIPYIPPPPEHQCSYPAHFYETRIEKRTFLFFFTKDKEVLDERIILPGSLYRCPDCLKVSIFKECGGRYSSSLEWRITKEAASLWLDKTGEFVDNGES
jgi:hypothetical protein